MDVTTSYNNRCRLCIAEAKLSLQLFESEAIRLDLVNKIRSYLSINVSLHDGLPQQICYECLSRIELFHSYKQSCLESQHTLKHWNLFCDGGSIPQNVDIFSGRTSPDVMVDMQSECCANILANRRNTESEVRQCFQFGDITPLRNTSHLSSPLINKSSAATPPKKSTNLALSEQEISPQDRNKNLPKRVPLVDSATRKNINALVSRSVSSDASSYLQFTVSELNQRTDIKSMAKSSKQIPGKSVQSSMVETVADGETSPRHSKSPSPYRGRRSCTPMREIDSSSPHEVSVSLRKSSESSKSVLEARRQTSSRDQDTAKHSSEQSIESSDQKKSQSPNSSRKSQTTLDTPEQNMKSFIHRRSPSPHPSRRSQTPLNNEGGNIKSSSHSRSPSPYSSRKSQIDLNGPEQNIKSSVHSSSPSPHPSRRSQTSSKSTEENIKSTDLIRSPSPRSSRKCTLSSPEQNVKSSVHRRSPSPYPFRSQSPLNEIKPSPPEKIMPLTQKQPTSAKSLASEVGMNSRSQSHDKTKNREIITTDTSPIMPCIQIIRVESLAGKSKVKSPENDSLKMTNGNSSIASTSHKQNEFETPPKSQKMESVERSFSPTISEMVKQRKRSNCVSSQSYTSVKKPRKPCTRSSLTGTNKENSDGMKSDWESEKEDDSNFHSDVDENDTRSVQSLDDSTQALLRLLESDDEEEDFYQSESENFESERTGTSSAMVPNPYVSVEKLSEENVSKSDVGIEKELNTRMRGRRMSRPRQQSNQYRLVKAVKDGATGKERYKCLRCGSLLSNKSYIKEHMKIHTGDKDFKCEKCGRAFRNRYMLKAHYAVHMEERNFTCSICGNSFVQRERLIQHFRLHTAQPLKCKECDYETNQKQAMNRHMRTHTGERPYECEFCNGKYADRSTWINHRRIHTGERPYSCKLCGKTFQRIVYLQAHKKSHSNERPFPCNLCPKRFKTKAHLVKHLTSMHTELMKSVVDFMTDEYSGD